MLNKLKTLKLRYDELTEELAKSDVMNDKDRWRQLMKEHSNLEEIVAAYDAYSKKAEQLNDCKAMLYEHLDADMKEMVQEEIAELEGDIANLEEELKILLLPKDPNDDKNVMLEIRAGTGGDEASLFGADLLRMYLRYAERHHYKVEYITENMTELGGVKEVVLNLSKKGAYSRLKFESGVHRVQRVPETESQGRVHTSAATVAVLPDVDDVHIEILDSDLRIDTYRSSGAGGQHVNKTSSAIRITHLPTGVVVACQNERSQLQNKEQAMRLLKSRLYEIQQNEQHEQMASMKKSMVGSGDRSERIRTYNFPQGRVTDHRINMTLYKLDAFMDGDMDEMIDALIVAERAAQLSGNGDNA